MTGRSFFEENMETYKSQNGDQEEYNMCQALQEIREDFFNEGKAEGREEEREVGIRRLIEDNLEEKKTKEIIIQKLIRWFSMDEQTAQMYLDKYAGSGV